MSVASGTVATMNAQTVAGSLLVLIIGLSLGTVLGVLWSRSRQADAALARLSGGDDQARVAVGLDRLQEQLTDLGLERASWQAQLVEQVGEMRRSTETLRRETGQLTSALRKPQVRGQWGELHLRRCVELAGLVERCDFETQATIEEGDAAGLRPDLVVRLPGGRAVVVDAKVPLDAFLDVTAADEPEEQRMHLHRHARQVRAHVASLAGKAYWHAFDQAPDFVVMFVPNEGFLSAALDADPGLLEWAASRQVVVATPTTLIALLRAVALGWSQATLTEKAHQIHLLGRDLYDRLGIMGGHLDRLGRSLQTTVAAYNSAVGSLESRVLVSARRFTELGLDAEPLAAPAVTDAVARPLTAAELLDAVAESREPLPELSHPPDPAPRRASGT